MKEMGAEERLFWANRVYIDMIRRMIKAVEENYGDKGREIAINALYDVGQELGTKFCDLLHIKGKGTEDYAELHHYLDTNLYGIKEEISRGESGEAIIHAYSCPAQGIFTAKDCKAFLPYVRGLMDVINPNLKWKATKALTKGDDCCEFIISEAAPNEER